MTPDLDAAASPESAACRGDVPVPQIEHGQVTLTVVPADGVSRLPLSSTARVLIVVDRVAVGDPGVAPGDGVLRLDIVVAGCQVVPPSVETSTPATTPPPASVAVPVMVTLAVRELWRSAPAR